MEDRINELIKSFKCCIQDLQNINSQSGFCDDCQSYEISRESLFNLQYAEDLISESESELKNLKSQLQNAEKRESELVEKIMVLDVDNHFWSTRPCETCQDISDLINKPFGCIKKAKQKYK